jgi:dihydrolipoamide dehydrogenase
MTDELSFDLVVIGSGPGGYKAAVTAARLGARVALIEKGAPGGTCLNQGCIPKKSLLHLATLIEDVNALHGRGLRGHIRPDFKAAMAHKDEVIAAIRDNFPVWLRRLGIRVLHGHGRLRDARHVHVEPPPGAGAPLLLAAERIVIATGAEPRAHPACPFDGERIISSREFMLGLDSLPESVLCIGGGAIGTELGFLLHQFGARVTIVEHGSRLLDKAAIPERASATLERKLKRIGVEVRLGMSVSAVEHAGSGVAVRYTDGTTATYERVLVAIGRKPVTADLGLEQAGVARDADGFIPASEYLETNVPGIYVVGDVKPGPMTANAALHDAKIAATNAIHGNQLRTNYHRVPLVIDSALEIAAVGLTEELAESAGFEPDAARANFSGSAKARARHDYEGFIEVIHDEETGQLLGGCIVGPEAGEQIHMLAAACQSDRGLWFFRDISYTHPSWCEELENAIDPYAAAFTRSGKDIFTAGIYHDAGR